MQFQDLTEEDIEDFADSLSIFNRGKTYYRSGKIKSINIAGDKVSAKVTGNYGTYSVSVYVDDGEIEGKCSCPYDGYGCKHIVAVLFALMNGDLPLQQRPSSLSSSFFSSHEKHKTTPKITSKIIPKKTRWNISLEDITGSENIETILEALDFLENSQIVLIQDQADQVRAKVGSNVISIRRNTSYWRDSLFLTNCSCGNNFYSTHCVHRTALLIFLLKRDHPEAVPSHYRQDLQNIYHEERFRSLVEVLHKTFEETPSTPRKCDLQFSFGWDGEEVSVMLHKVLILKSGKTGQPAKVTKQWMNNYLPFLSPRKQEIVRYLMASIDLDGEDSFFYGNTLEKKGFEQPIDKELLQFFRLLYHEEPCAFQDCVFPREKGQLEINFAEEGADNVLEIWLDIKGTKHKLEKKNSSLIEAGSLWIFHQNEKEKILCEVAAEKPAVIKNIFPFIGTKISHSNFHDFVEQYYIPLSKAGTVLMPKKFAVQEENDIIPLPRAYLRDHGGTFSIELRFLYGEQETSASAKQDIIFRNQEKAITCIKRKEDVEQQYISMLLEHNVIREDEAFIPSKDPFGWLADDVPSLIKKGFEIFGQKELTNYRVVEEEPTLHLDVSSGIDWFDLKMEVVIAGEKIPFSKIIASLREHERFIKLSDGRMGVIPKKWMSKLSGIAGFLQADQKKETLKAAKSQIAAIESLLNIASSSKVDKKTQEFREKFSKFKEIKDVDLPKGLQGNLRPYQKAGYDWLNFLQEFSFGGCLADEMGLGKTLQVLTLLLKEKEKGNGKVKGKEKEDGKRKERRNEKHSLVVVPTSLVFNWCKEVEKFTPDIKVYVHHGQNRLTDMKEIKKQEADIILTTYGTLKNDLPLFEKETFHYIILDESQNIKNPLTKIASCVYGLKSKYRLAISGTPIENTSLELWSQFAFLNPGLLGRMEYFKSAFTKKIEQEKDENKTQALRQMVNPFILLRKKGMVAEDLPDKQVTTLYCEMEPKQKEVYEHWKEKFRQEIASSIAKEGLNKSRFKILQGLTLLRQVCNHPSLIDESFTGSSGKFNLILEQLEEVIKEGHKVLVFSSFVKMLRLFKDHFEKEKISFCYLDGQTRNRQEQVARFQEDPEVKVFLISLKAGGLGLNLTAADYVFIVDPWWNPAVEMQAIDRAHRIGQKNNVFVYKLITKDSVEEKILELQESKMDLVKNVITVEESIFKKLDQRDIQQMFG